MKLSVVIIVYYPHISEIHKNISEYIDLVENVIIWDNTPSDGYTTRENLFTALNPKIIYLSTGVNKGIGFALNQAVIWSLHREFTHIMTMDQDSLLKRNDFLKLIESVIDLEENCNIGIISPNIINLFSKKLLPLYESETKYIVVSKSITSGSVFCLNDFNRIGLFREDLFIDEVDYEFCYRAKINGLSTVIVKDSLLYQKFSEMKYCELGFYITNYSPFRIYHIIRNAIIVRREFPEFTSSWFHFILFSIIIRSLKILFFEKNKIDKFRGIFLGIYDGIFLNVKERLFV